MNQRRFNPAFLVILGAIFSLLLIFMMNSHLENISLAKTSINEAMPPLSTTALFNSPRKLDGQKSNDIIFQANASHNRIFNIETYDANNNIMAIHDEQKYVGFTSNLNYGFPVLAGELLADPEFQVTGTASCNWVPASRMVQCTGNISNFTLSYQVKPIVTNAGININVSIIHFGGSPNLKVDLFYPSSLHLMGYTSSPITPFEIGHLLWNQPSSSQISASVTFLITQQPRFFISGQVTDTNGDPIPGVTISTGAKNATTNASGIYTITNLIGGTYTITPTKANYVFAPVDRTVSGPPSRPLESFQGWTCKGGKFDEWRVIPLRIFVLKGVSNNDITNDQIYSVVDEANNYLKQSHISLRISNIDRGNTPDTNQDGKISDIKEREQLRVYASSRLNGIGYGVIIANELFYKPGIPVYGYAAHTPNKPISYIEIVRTQTGLLLRNMGNTLVHEFGHSFLPSFHHVVDKPTNNPDCSWEKDDEKADKDGHTTPSNNVPNNIMDAQEWGYQFTKEQIIELYRRSYNRGWEEVGPHLPQVTLSNTRNESKFAEWTDNLEDTTKPQIDLFVGSLFVRSAAANLEMTIELGGTHPASPVNSRFEILFNTDNNTATGTTFGSFQGVDKILTIVLVGQYPFMTKGWTASHLLDIATATSTALPAGDVQRVLEIVDTENPLLSSTYEVSDVVHQSILLPQLNIRANQVPMAIRAIDLISGTSDEVVFTFNFNPPPRPYVEISLNIGKPGDKITIKGTSFLRNSTISIYMDDDPVKSVSSLSNGSFTTSFEVPNVPSDFYFVTAQDSNGDFDFSILSVNAMNIYLPIIRK